MTLENIKSYLPAGASVSITGNVAAFAVPAERLPETILGLYREKQLPLKLMTATDTGAGGCRIWYVFGVPGQDIFLAPFLELSAGGEFPSLALSLPETWSYEKRIRTFFGLKPAGHPDERPLILHENWPADAFPLRRDFGLSQRPAAATASYDFQQVGGEGIYEIPVGPIHAGIIEPGHFRFSVAGEEIVLLEPRLGFVHKGSEKLFESLSLTDSLRLSEKISGDSSFSHSLAFCQAVEKLAGVAVPARALYLRVLYAELERLANHFGDIGAIMIDTGFNFGGAQGARLRETVMRMNVRLSNSRFLRGVNRIGGVAKDVTDGAAADLAAELEKTAKDFSQVLAVAEHSTSLLNRLHDTGQISREAAQRRGAVGVAARAAGIAVDARVDFPYAAYGLLGGLPIETETDGDVYARFRVRVKEARASLDLIRRALAALPSGPIAAATDNIELAKEAVAIGLVEGWRGDIAYFVATDKTGKISRVSPRDPSFLNWPLVGDAGLGNVVPDFPLINKSFNLSYSGNDL